MEARPVAAAPEGGRMTPKDPEPEDKDYDTDRDPGDEQP